MSGPTPTGAYAYQCPTVEAARRVEASIEDLVERLMGKRAEARFQFIQENAQFVKEELDV